VFGTVVLVLHYADDVCRGRANNDAKQRLDDGQFRPRTHHYPTGHSQAVGSTGDRGM